MLLFFQLLLFILYMISEAYNDATGFKKGDFFVSHRSRVIKRTIVTLILTFGVFPTMLLFIGIWVFSFDYLINIYWGKEITYIGGTAKWDLMLQNLKPITIFILKLIFLILTITAYVFIKNIPALNLFNIHN